MKTKIVGLLIALAMFLSACGSAVPTTIAPIETFVVPTATADADVYKDESQTVDARVDDLLARMTLEEKIGQMTQVEKDSIKPGDITKYFIGSILSGGGGSPSENTPAAWYEMVNGFQDEALATPLGIPLIYGVDAVHGHGNLLDATIFPHNIGLGAANDPELVCHIAKATAEEMLATGIPWNFSPVVAVIQDVRWGRTYEGFSENTDIVTSLGESYVRCTQTPQEGVEAPLGALATPKHFIGDGATAWGSSRANDYKIDQGDMQVDEATLRELLLPPYQAAVDAGAMSIMASFSSWNGTKMHAQKGLLTDLLKGELGFKGFIVSDWQAIDQIDPDYYKSVVTAINAGVDMNMVPYDYVKFIDTMKQAVAAGDIPQERLDDAVRRILLVKFELGLFEHPMPDVKYQETVRSEEHLALAREAVSKSLVLLTNQNETLPLDKNVGTILLSGSGADNIGMQTGGWTLQWQGVNGNNTEGTSIHEAIQQAVGANTKLIYDAEGLFKDQEGIRADIGIVVIGEEPYAEGVGDSDKLLLSFKDVDSVSKMREHANKVVVIVVSGRPVNLSGILPNTDAIVAAWCFGTEGAGVTDVLFGDKPFTGKLPYTWPRSANQLPLNSNNIGDRTGCEGPLFPFGYGLTYGEPSPEILECK